MRAAVWLRTGGNSLQIYGGLFGKRGGQLERRRRVKLKGKKKILGWVLSTAMVVTGIMPVNTLAAEPGEEEPGQPALRMWYDSPATDWESEASPLGNGFMGAMIFGGVDSDQILINEHTLWSGGPGADPDYDGGHNDNTSEENAANLKRAQELLQDEVTAFTENNSAYIDESTGQVISSNFNESSEVRNLINSLKGDKTNFGHYQQLSNIMITNTPAATVTPIHVESNSANADSENQQYQEGPEKAFDNNLDTKWYSTGGLSGDAQQEFPAWVTVEYEEPVTTSQYAIVSGNDTPARDPKAWNLYGSNDGEEFVLLDAQTDVAFSNRIETKYFPLDEEVSYKYYKFEVTELYGDAGGCQMQEVIINAPSDEASDYTNYVRALDLDTAVATVDYTIDETNYHREYFVSNPGNVMAVRLTADQENSITKYFSITTPQTKAEITAEGDTITLTGTPADHGEDGLHFAQQVKVILPGDGEMKADENGGILVTDADEVLLLMSAGTNYQQCMDDSYDYFSDEDPLDGVKERIAAAEEKGYEALKEEHIADYKSLYDNVKLNLGSNVPDKATDALLAGYNGRSADPNTAEEDLYLETMYYQFGRYLMISSSREGSLPANLQGIWANGLNPPWDADYHTNINVQMNYWLAEQTNLSECHEPLIRYINSLVPRGSETAKKVFGEDTRGWTTFHENNIWGNTAPAVSDAFFTPTAAAWLCQDIWEVYAFNLDEEFLAENYDTMLQSAIFLVDILVEDERDGTLVVSPSYSPEHGPYSLGSTFDQAVVWDIFNNVILASEVLGKEDTPEVQEIKIAFENLSGPKIGLAGQFQEWKDETTMDITGDGGHRHVNHLYGLHPGKQFVAGRSEEDDQYIEAMKETLNTRGDGGTGWSKAWKINFWARLRDGDHAHKMVEEQLKESTLTNLFDTHPPFQIDGNFGATAGMTEMLLQSQGDSIDLLAAMPADWDAGSVTGLRARGDVTVDMTWQRSTLTGAVLTAGTDGELKVRGENIGTSTLTDSNGNAVEYTKVDADTITFDAAAGTSYTISEIRNEEGVAQAREDLQELIATAQEKLDARSPEDEIYDEGANKALEEAIKTAQAVLDSGTQDYFVLTDAVSALQEAINDFDDAYNIALSVSPASGIYDGGLTVKVECASSIVDIRYTIDGSEPTADSPKYYNGIVLPYGISTVKAATFLGDKQINDTVTIEYMVNDDNNLALGRSISVTQGTNVISGYGPEKSVDGDASTRLATNGSGAGVEIDLGSAVEVSAVSIDQFVENYQTTRIQEYTVEYWDGENWVECDHVRNDVKEADNIIFNNDPDNNPTQHAYMGSTFDPVTTSKIRINMTGGEVSIWEIGVYGNVPAVDRTALEQAILDAESIELDGYTEESVKALQEALAHAKETAENDAAAQEDVDAAAAALNQAIAGLVSESGEDQTVSKKTLEYFLNSAKEHVANGDVDNCVESVQKLFEEAIAEGETVMADADATRDEVMNATIKLVKAIHALDMQAADKTDLEMAVELGDMIDLSKYVEAGQQEFTDTLAAAKEVLADGDAMQGDVDEAWDALVTAMENLRLKASKDALEDLLNEAAGLDLSRYTEESAAAFRAALASAQAVFADETLSEADQQKVDDAAAALKAAKDGLVAKADGSGEGNETGNGSSANKAAKTGDTAPIAGWILLMIGTGAAALAVYRKRIKL